MLLARAFGCTCMAFDQATRERRCISECTCAMQTVSWPPTYLATCITLPLSVRGPTEKFFLGVATRFASGHRKSATQACTNDVYCRKGTTQRWAIVSFASSLSELCHALACADSRRQPEHGNIRTSTTGGKLHISVTPFMCSGQGARAISDRTQFGRA